MSRRHWYESFSFIAKEIAKEKKWLGIGIVLTLFLSLMVWSGPRLIGWIIDHGMIPHNHPLFWKGVIALGCVELLRLGSQYLSQVTYSLLGQNVIERIRAKMIAHLLNLPIAYFDRVSSGKMMTRVVNDVNSLSDFFQSGFVSVLGNVFNVVAILVGIFSLNLRLGFILTMAFVPIVLVCGYFSKRLKEAYENSRNQLSLLNAMLADFLFGMRTIRSLALNRPKYKELDGQIQNYANAQMDTVQNFALFHPILSLGIGVLLILHLIVGIPLVHSGVLDVGEWIAGMSYVLLLSQPLVEISDRWNFFLVGLTAIERIMHVLKVKEQQETGHEKASFESVSDSIELKNVSFRYESIEAKNSSALSNVSLKIKKGDRIGIFGESGSGKSTLLQLLFRFYEPTEGELLWNQENYMKFARKSLQQNFGVVEQFPFLFSGTVRENITLFGKNDSEKSKIDWDLLKQEFKGYVLIESVLENLDLHLHERGTNLSMGQKQMVAFLRAYLARPSIWVLDEATAFFDDEAEQEVLQALERLGESVTVIQVAHRPRALSMMKRWLKVDQGKVTEQSGNLHSDLTHR